MSRGELVQRWVVEGKGVEVWGVGKEAHRGSAWNRTRGVGTRAGTAGTHSSVDCTLFVGRAAGRSTERQRFSRPA